MATVQHRRRWKAATSTALLALLLQSNTQTTLGFSSIKTASRSVVKHQWQSSSSTSRHGLFAYTSTTSPISSDDDISAVSHRSKLKGWHRRVLNRFFSVSSDKEISKRRSGGKAESVGARGDEISLLELNDIATLFGTSEEETLRVMQEQMETMDIDERDVLNEAGGWSLFSPVTRSLGHKMLTSLLHRLSDGVHEGLVVETQPTGNAIDFFRGFFRSDASVEFDRIVFRPIRMSGGRVEARRLALNLWSFLGKNNLKPKPRMRYPNQFDFHAHGVIFTQADLFESNCIRNGLGRLITRILKRQGGMASPEVTITSIRILSSGKLSVSGEAATIFGKAVPFEVRTSLGTAASGRVLTFPGLEFTINPSLGLFVPVIPEISLDLGKNAKLTSISIVPGRPDAKGTREEPQLVLGAKVTITPHHTLQLEQFFQPQDALSVAGFSVDVGRWLTRTGNFN